jgi:hypothetical protein
VTQQDVLAKQLTKVYGDEHQILVRREYGVGGITYATG